jgi:hypothetical protein
MKRRGAQKTACRGDAGIARWPAGPQWFQQRPVALPRLATPTSPIPGAGRLRRTLTLREAAAFGVSGTSGGGIFVLAGKLHRWCPAAHESPSARVILWEDSGGWARYRQCNAGVIMELLILLAFIGGWSLLAVLAVRFGYDSRDGIGAAPQGPLWRRPDNNHRPGRGHKARATVPHRARGDALVVRRPAVVMGDAVARTERGAAAA